MAAKDQTDLYAVLEVAPTVTAAELDHAFRRVVRRHHPDTRAADQPASGEDQRLQQILAAYAVLRDPTTRAAYDRRRTPRPRTARSPGDPESPPIRFGPVRWHPPHG